MGYATSYTLFAHRVADPEIAERIAESLRSSDVIGYALSGDYQFAEDGVEFFPMIPSTGTITRKTCALYPKNFPTSILNFMEKVR